MRIEGHRNTTLSGDTRVDWSEAFELVPSLEVGYVWHAVHVAEVALGLERIGFEIASQVIWAKGLFAMSKGCSRRSICRFITGGARLAWRSGSVSPAARSAGFEAQPWTWMFPCVIVPPAP
jgi:hypothetical protein